MSRIRGALGAVGDSFKNIDLNKVSLGVGATGVILAATDIGLRNKAMSDANKKKEQESAEKGALTLPSESTMAIGIACMCGCVVIVTILAVILAAKKK